ncbi:MAG: hypothetical protein ACYDBH_18055 [Acidobacteriaceae bacterium]
MNRLLIATALLTLSAAASAMTMPGSLPPMPANCTTPATMNIWYGEVAKQNLMAHRSPADCKAKLTGLGGTPGEAGRACS